MTGVENTGLRSRIIRMLNIRTGEGCCYRQAGVLLPFICRLAVRKVLFAHDP